MGFAVSDLPDDVESLRAIIAEQAIRLQARDSLIEKLRAQLAVLKWARFGRSSEKIERAIAQLELALEDIEATDAEVSPAVPAVVAKPKAKPSRQPLPEHLPRDEIVHEAVNCACPTCGGHDFLKAGTVETEVLEYVPSSFRVVRHVQPRYVCKGCDGEVISASVTHSQRSQARSHRRSPDCCSEIKGCVIASRTGSVPPTTRLRR